ncbi:MAG TPA: DNA methyltransferase [Solirubrobacteraceae bacterium]|nr:DNA methyltransferase [Solirubrobacteraceae bacterium]
MGAGTAGLPLAVWPCAQRTGQWQRHGRYTPASTRHPAKMLPEIARRAIEFYSSPGQTVLDPLCGIGTTLVEAIHQDRRAIGVELDPKWAALAAANVQHARAQGAPGQALVLTDDARGLGRGVLDEYVGKVALILTSPPYGPATLGDPRGGKGMAIARAREGRRLTAADRAYAKSRSKTCRYGDSRPCLARLRYGNTHDATNHGDAGESYLSAMAGVYRACARMLAPGAFLILVTKNLRTHGALRNLAGDTVALCQNAGLDYWQHVIALLAGIRDDQLHARPSFWQLLHARGALATGERTQLVCHEDVLVFRRPPTPPRTHAMSDSRRRGEHGTSTTTNTPTLAAQAR